MKFRKAELPLPAAMPVYVESASVTSANLEF